MYWICIYKYGFECIVCGYEYTFIVRGQYIHIPMHVNGCGETCILNIVYGYLYLDCILNIVYGYLYVERYPYTIFYVERYPYAIFYVERYPYSIFSPHTYVERYPCTIFNIQSSIHNLQYTTYNT